MASANPAASDRSALIKLAASLPAGSPERKTILAGLGKMSSGPITPEEFAEKMEHGFTPSKTLRVYSDRLDGQHDDVYILAGERYKAKVLSWRAEPVRGKGPWAGIPDAYGITGKWMMVAAPWRAVDLDKRAAMGESTLGYQQVKGKWAFFDDKTPVGHGNSIEILSSDKGPSKTWLKVLSESR
jgi:hypothetical protein